MKVSTASSTIKCWKTMSDFRELERVPRNKTRRIAAIKPIRRSGSGMSACSRNETLDCVEQLDDEQNQEHAVQQRDDFRRQRAGD